jgi:hypothetical protein
MVVVTKAEKQRRSELGRSLATGRWKDATPEERATQVQRMVQGKKNFWKKLSPEERSKRMKMVRAQKKHAKAPLM